MRPIVREIVVRAQHLVAVLKQETAALQRGDFGSFSKVQEDKLELINLYVLTHKKLHSEIASGLILSNEDMIAVNEELQTLDHTARENERELRAKTESNQALMRAIVSVIEGEKQRIGGYTKRGRYQKVLVNKAHDIVSFSTQEAL